jgi:hypothetical protein
MTSQHILQGGGNASADYMGRRLSVEELSLVMARRAMWVSRHALHTSTIVFDGKAYRAYATPRLSCLNAPDQRALARHDAP